MKTDIKNTFTLYKYPEVDKAFNEYLTILEIEKYITDHEGTFRCKYLANEQYYLGQNIGINKTESHDEYAPCNKIPVPYSRTFVTTIKGYMFKPSLISYDSEDENYLTQLQEIFDYNNEEIKTAEIGEDQGKFGIGIELLFTVPETEISEDNEIELNNIPYFTKIKPYETVLIYQRKLNKPLYCAIRYYEFEKKDDGSKVFQVEVYYKDRVEEYSMVKDISNKKVITLIQTYPHFFGDVPIVTYVNNDEFQADYEPVQPLIDAYDKLISDGLNEMDRFASAYLVFQNYILANTNDENEARAKLERIKKFRVFEVTDDGDVRFLTKDIPSEFFNFFKQTIREDIEYHSHIPDFRSAAFTGKSGEAMKYALIDFENLAADKQAQIEKGLQRRIRLINNFLKIKAIESGNVVIKFERNLPSNDTQMIDNVIKLKQNSLLADEDLLALLPVDMVPDVQKALDNLNKQKEENMAMFDLDKVNEDEEVEQEELENKEKSNNFSKE